jgi:hypothetical protein
MRITDPGEEAVANNSPASSIMEQIKSRSTVAESNTGNVTGKITAEVGSNKLKAMLAGLKSTSQM